MLASKGEPLMSECNNLNMLIQQNMLHTRLLPFVADLASTSPTSTDKISQQIHNVFGKRVDILILSAGLLEPIKRLKDYDHSDFKKLHDHFMVNVLSQYKLISDLLPFLKQSASPRIISLSSSGAQKPYVYPPFINSNLLCTYTCTYTYTHIHIQIHTCHIVYLDQRNG